MLRKKTTALKVSSRPSRTGELGNTFPNYCILCKKETAIYVNNFHKLLLQIQQIIQLERQQFYTRMHQ